MANKKFDNEKDQQIHDTLVLAYKAMEEKKYNPISQLAGFILSSDETYVTTYNNARGALTKLDTEDILQHLLESYFEG